MPSVSLNFMFLYRKSFSCLCMVLLISYISKPFLIQVFGGIVRRRNSDPAFCPKQKIRTRY